MKSPQTRAGRWLAHWRVDKRMSRLEMSTKMGVPETTLRAIEIGKMHWNYMYVVAMSLQLTEVECEELADCIWLDVEDSKAASLVAGKEKLGAILAPLRGKSNEKV